MIRRDPNMTEKLACALLHWLHALGAPIPREHAQLMTADQICSLFQFDHWPIRYADGGTTHPDNLQPSFIAAHREKTATIDVPQISKRKRIVETEGERTKRVMTEIPVIAAVIDGLDEASVARRPTSRLRSRGFDKTRTRGFDNKVRPRKQRRQP